jgi:hypothetical protein
VNVTLWSRNRWSILLRREAVISERLGRFLQQLDAIMTAVLRLLEVQRIPLIVSNAGGVLYFQQHAAPSTQRVNFQTNSIIWAVETCEILQLRRDAISSESVMVKQDFASFADSNCHSSPVGFGLSLIGIFLW